MKVKTMPVSNYKNWTNKPSFTYVFSYFSVYCVILIILQISTTTATIPSCDYEGSGLDSNGKEVQSVYLSCTKGRITWKFPRGALRISITNPNKQEFRGCLKSTIQSSGARIFVEGHRTLIRVYPEGGLSKNTTRCFVSYQSRISFYVEASPMKEFRKLITIFEYQLESLTTDDYNDPYEECQPCSPSQMVRSYCSSDFAAKGRFVSFEDNSESEQTIITFAAARVFQQNTPIFLARSHSSETGFQNDKNKVPGSMEMAEIGRLRVPIKCEASISGGEFVVLGTVRLGEPLLKCAASIDDWRRFVRDEQDRVSCDLEQ